MRTLDIKTINEVEEFIQAYLVCALWSSTDDNDEPLDNNYGIDDISFESQFQANKDCLKFIKDNHDLLSATPESYPMQQAGHDFWLTRVGHGAGFWDRDLGIVGDKLTDLSKKYRNLDLMVSDGVIDFV